MFDIMIVVNGVIGFRLQNYIRPVMKKMDRARRVDGRSCNAPCLATINELSLHHKSIS